MAICLLHFGYKGNAFFPSKRAGKNPGNPCDPAAACRMPRASATLRDFFAFRPLRFF